MSTHSLLRALKANKPAFGAWLTAPGYLHARTVAQASPHLSWVAVDCEHGLISLNPGAAESVAAIHSTTVSPSALVRIPATGITGSTSWQIKHALDAGARGVIIPMVRDISISKLVYTPAFTSQVSTAEKAREIVSDSKFPPAGRRGYGNPYTQDSWSVTPAEYLKTANQEILVMAQIETREGFENIKEIAEVDGIGASR